MHHPFMSDDESHRYTEWDCRPELAAEARETAYRFLAGLCPTPSAHASQNLVLVVSELVTNSLRHAGEVTSLRLCADRRSLRIVVKDPSPALPATVRRTSRGVRADSAGP